MALQKFMFDLDFTAPQREPAETYDELDGLDGLDAAPPEEPPPPPPPPTFSEEELQFAREQAYEQGRADGAAEMEHSAERQLAMAIALAADQMAGLKAAIATATDEAAKGAVRVAMAIAAKMLPEMARAGRLTEMAAMVAECLDRVIDEPRLLVRCHDELVAPLRDRLESVAADLGYEGKVVVQADGRLAPGDMRVEWTDGAAERDETHLWREIEDILERSVGAPLAPPAGDAADTDAAPRSVSEE